MSEASDSPKNQLIINKPPLLFEKTQQIIEQIENELNATFLAYWTSTNGSICQSDVAGLQEVLQRIGNKNEIVLFIKSEGGSGQASLRIVHLLRHYTSQLKVLVPLVCASAATMIALGADEIHMGPLAYLTAVDTAITHNLSPIDSYNNLVSVSQDELSCCAFKTDNLISRFGDWGLGIGDWEDFTTT